MQWKCATRCLPVPTLLLLFFNRSTQIVIWKLTLVHCEEKGIRVAVKPANEWPNSRLTSFRSTLIIKLTLCIQTIIVIMNVYIMMALRSSSHSDTHPDHSVYAHLKCAVFTFCCSRSSRIAPSILANAFSTVSLPFRNNLFCTFIAVQCSALLRSSSARWLLA